MNTLRKLSRHDVTDWALIGGLAVEIHCLLGGQPTSTRQSNDIDFVASMFDCIPETLAADFLFRHVHPFDPPGKTIMQLVDAETALRIDLFRDLSRRHTGPYRQTPLDLRDGIPVPEKHANDYMRLASRSLDQP